MDTITELSLVSYFSMCHSPSMSGVSVAIVLQQSKFLAAQIQSSIADPLRVCVNFFGHWESVGTMPLDIFGCTRKILVSSPLILAITRRYQILA